MIQESFDLKTILKTDIVNLRFLSFEKGKACQSILIMLHGKTGLSKPEIKKGKVVCEAFFHWKNLKFICLEIFLSLFRL